jgi:hypothetical protein
MPCYGHAEGGKMPCKAEAAGGGRADRSGGAQALACAAHGAAGNAARWARCARWAHRPGSCEPLQTPLLGITLGVGLGRGRVAD